VLVPAHRRMLPSSRPYPASQNSRAATSPSTLYDSGGRAQGPPAYLSKISSSWSSRRSAWHGSPATLAFHTETVFAGSECVPAAITAPLPSTMGPCQCDTRTRDNRLPDTASKACSIWCWLFFFSREKWHSLVRS
jgi:hypothetical protein